MLSYGLVKKGGRNTYSNYDYFTPSQVEQLVHEACKQTMLLTNFNLIRNEFGITGKLTVIDIENGESIDFDMLLYIS